VDCSDSYRHTIASTLWGQLAELTVNSLEKREGSRETRPDGNKLHERADDGKGGGGCADDVAVGGRDEFFGINRARQSPHSAKTRVSDLSDVIVESGSSTESTPSDQFHVTEGEAVQVRGCTGSGRVGDAGGGTDQVRGKDPAERFVDVMDYVCRTSIRQLQLQVRVLSL